MHTIALADLNERGSNAPINDFSVINDEQLNPILPHGHVARLQKMLLRDVSLDALVVNKNTDVLVVAFHGATNREKTVLPRFEWLRTILEFEVNSLYFSDPTLHLDPKLQLAWYTGWDAVDVQQIVAEQIQRVAENIGAARTILTGSSGGGFAALQISALIPDSVALVFNAQTAISEYRVGGTNWGVQRYYVKNVWPEVSASLEPPHQVEDRTWDLRVDDRVSAIRRYSVKRENRVYMVQNEEEFHYREHFIPFLKASLSAGNDILPSTNREGPRHNPPIKSTFKTELSRVISAEAQAHSLLVNQSHS